MYFIPHKSRFFSYVAHVPRLYRYMFTFISLLLLMALCYGLYLIMEQQLQYDQQSIAQLQQQYNQLCQTEHSCDLQKKYTDTLQDQFSRYSFAAEDHFVQQQLQEILQEAKKQNVHVLELSLIKQTAKPWYQRQDIQLNGVGSFSGITQILAAFKNNGRMISCKDFSCQRSKDSLYMAHYQLRSLSLSK